VQAFLTERLAVDGFIVQQFTLNEIRVPEQVVTAINAKVAMTQEALKAKSGDRRPGPALRQKRGQDAPGRGISPWREKERPCPTGSLS
jgi:hypothetical protein